MSSYRLLIGGYEGQIHALEFSPLHQDSERRLKITSSQACGKAPTWLTLSEDGKSVYCLDEWGQPHGDVTALQVDEIGQLTKLTTVSTGGLWPCHSVLLPSVEPPRLIATNYKGASIASIPLHASGDLDLTSSSFSRIEYLGTRQPGPHKSRQTQDHPHGAHLDPTGKLIVIPDLGTDDLRLIGVKDDGSLEELDEVHMNDGDGPRHCVFSKNGERLYVLNELDNSISVYSVDYPPPLLKILPTSSPRYPTLSLLQSNISLLPPQPFPHQSDFSSWHAAELILSPSNQTLYASNRAEGHNPLHPPSSSCSDLLAIFPLDSSNGKLIEEEREFIEIGGRCPRHFDLIGEGQEGGKWMVVCCHDSDEVIVFERKGLDGRKLEEVARLTSCGKPAVVVCLPLKKNEEEE